MLDFETIIQIFFIVFAAMALFAGVWTIADNFNTWNDFFKIFKDKGYSYLSFVFRKGKHLRFITDFPADLRNACLGKNSFYMETEEDKNPKKAKQREAKRLVKVVLTSDDLINGYFRGQYFIYEDYLSLKETISASAEEDEKSRTTSAKGAIVPFERVMAESRSRATRISERHTALRLQCRGDAAGGVSGVKRSGYESLFSF